jgi:hypothetical protein
LSFSSFGNHAAGPEGALLERIVSVYQPVLWLVLAGALFVVVLSVAVWAIRRLR